jgi:hypothetical protein
VSTLAKFGAAVDELKVYFLLLIISFLVIISNIYNTFGEYLVLTRLKYYVHSFSLAYLFC